MRTSQRTLVVLATIIPAVLSVSFSWGFGGSAMQIEGAWNEDGKSESIYDHWYHSPAKAGDPNADVAADHYHRWREDIGYMAQLKATAYRFSISWPRILPNCTGAVNEAGVKFYSDLIDELIKNNIEPFLTMFHWDMPQACYEQTQGFLSKDFVSVFAQYAAVLYDRFGDRYWLTLNELEANCQFSYGQGIFAPLHKGGDPDKYLCIRNSHLIHGTVVNLARKSYPPAKNWKFGLPSIVTYFEAVEPSFAAEATNRQNSVSGLFYDPVVFGDYGAEAKADPNVVPFTPEESALIKGTMDFVAVNYYSGSGVGGNVGPDLASGIRWQNVYPKGIRGLCKYMYERYKSDIYITEIGYPVPEEASFTTQAQVVEDEMRRRFWEMTVSNVTAAVVEDNIPVKGLLAWALLDNFEWVDYVPRFGAVAVDFYNGTLNRAIKKSTFWLADYYNRQNLSSPFAPRPAATPTGANGGPTNRVTTSPTVTTTDNTKKQSGAMSLSRTEAVFAALIVLPFLFSVL
ncbi:hypothetical protein HDU97_008858 [Phlyctochytrium planicorne]|nr:hypothetical protein HDU97_008858 [Phlyctochytrium planicorne]